jgi:phosphoribosylamine--glycine ligase
MRVMVIGGGAREHAMAWKLKQSPRVCAVVVAPGNAGTACEPGISNLSVDASNVVELVNQAQKRQIDLTIVGSEMPLAVGIVDAFQKAGLRIFGPPVASARLETSKHFAKQFLARHHVPMARHQSFSNLDQALAHIGKHSFPLVIKADGLAAGKGVVVASDFHSAETALRFMLEQKGLGEAGNQVVIEDCLEGRELSYIVMCDGRYALPLPISQDYKRRDDHHLGPNTGGMGAISPVPGVSAELECRIREQIVLPTIAGMLAENMPFVGFLYFGLMIDAEENPKVLEINVRCGDPETQVLMLRLRSDFLELIEAALDQRLEQIKPQWDSQSALALVLAVQSYPEQKSLGQVIEGLEEASLLTDKIFHAGTSLQAGKIVTAGGRMLSVCALGPTLKNAREKAYAAVKPIRFLDMFYRQDIGACDVSSSPVAT